jgi:hypothetical protein
MGMVIAGIRLADYTIQCCRRAILDIISDETTNFTLFSLLLRRSGVKVNLGEVPSLRGLVDLTTWISRPSPCHIEKSNDTRRRMPPCIEVYMLE